MTQRVVTIFFFVLGIAALLVTYFFFDSGSQAASQEQVTYNFEAPYTQSVESTGVVHEFQLTAGKSDIEVIPGVTFEGFTYNGTVPGPTWRIQKGDTVRVTVRNTLDQDTTVHFHGVRVPNNMDGVPAVTQEPIAPGASFTYEFMPKDAGTYWFHPHVRSSEQVEKGLYGVLIVEDASEPVYTTDTVWVVDDWRLLGNGELDTRFNTPHDLMHDGRWGNVLTVNGNVNETLVVQPGARVRLRLINVSNARAYKLGFSGLSAQVIAVDGLLSGETFSAEHFELAPGNRLDVDLTIPKDADGQIFQLTDTFLSGRTNTLGIIQVEGDVIQVQDFAVPTNEAFKSWQGAALLQPDHTIALNAVSAGGMMNIKWTINGGVYPETEPILLQEGEFQTIAFENKTTRLHPMHLHGQFFQVISRNHQPSAEPFMRDTVLVHANETVLVGIVPQDKGDWAQHCHILEHAEAGMMNIVTVE